MKTTLVNLVCRYNLGPKSISTQLAIALADLAVLEVSWADPIADVSSALAKNQNDGFGLLLLEFLKLLPEEMYLNDKIFIEVQPI